MMAGYGIAPAPTAMTPQTFATGLLHDLGDPTTPQNVGSLEGWEAREGGAWHNSANANPLNTTENAPGATSMNGVGVKSYLNWNQGEQATKSTLENGDYDDILNALHSGRGLSGNLAGLSKWSGGGYSSISPTTYSAPAKSYGVTSAAQPAASSRQQYVQGLAKGIVEHGDAGDFANELTTAIQKHPYNASPGTLSPGTTQQIPSEHLGTIATLGDDPHNLALAGALAISHDPRLGTFNRLVQSADAVNQSHYNYEWGGGHDTSFAPTSGSGHGSGAGVGYDCSGVLSHILHMAGVLNQPLVSGQFAELNRYVPTAQPGPGTGPHTITIYANAEHTFAKIGGTYFGTSSENPGGGAGWIGATTENNNADFTAWHINF